MIERHDLVPACPSCGHSEWLVSIYIFHAASALIIKQVWQCSNDFVGWSGCGWSGATPLRVKKSQGSESDSPGISFDKIPENQKEAARKLQEEGELILVLRSDGSKEVVL